VERLSTVKTSQVSGGNAVIVGGSLAGLLAARVLSETVEHVTIVDRDELPVEPVHRRGVPQSRHTHGLLARGLEIFEELLPGLEADLVARGALVQDLQQDVIWYNDGHPVVRAPSALRVLLVSRPTLESYVRSRVAALPRVTILAQTEAVGLLKKGDQLTGVDVLGPNGVATLDARVVVDASGRSNRGPAWLAELGYPRVAEDVVRANLVYVSREYRRVPGAQPFTGVIHSHYPANPVGSGSLAMDGNRWLVTMLGVDDDFPPARPGDFEEFATRLAGDELHRLITSAEPVSGRAERAPPVRAVRAATRGVHRARRLVVLLQPGVRPGHDDGGDDGTVAADLCRGRAAGPDPALLQGGTAHHRRAVGHHGRERPALPAGGRAAYPAGTDPQRVPRAAAPGRHGRPGGGGDLHEGGQLPHPSAEPRHAGDAVAGVAGTPVHCGRPIHR
jgi:hypothetical protein